VAGLRLGDTHRDQGAFPGGGLNHESVLIAVDLPQPGVHVPQPHMVAVAVPREDSPQLFRIHPHAVVLNGHLGERAGVVGSDGDVAGTFLGLQAVPDRVFHQRLQAQERDHGTEHLGGDPQAHLHAVAEAGPFQQEVAVDAAQFIGKNLRNKVARAWLTVLDGNNQVYGGPFLTADSLIDYQEMPVGDDGNVTARLLANVGFFSIERSQQLVWSHEQQQEDYPGDTGLSLIPSLIDKDVKWRLS